MKLMCVDANEVAKTNTGFGYSHIDIEKLSAPEFTIVQIVVDQSGSVDGFKTELENIMKTCVDSCKKSPRAENLLIRTTAFNSVGYQGKIEELHGFTLLNSIDSKIYDNSIDPAGGTPLYDSCLEGIETIKDFSKNLFDKQFFCNAIIFVITDGEENASTKCKSAFEINKSIKDLVKSETLESLTTVLIGVNTQQQSVKTFLDNFNQEVEFTQYVEIENATPSNLAKLAKFVSQSISSTSKALGSGGTSQPIDINGLTI